LGANAFSDLRKVRLAGTETVLYEWTAAATDPRFREVLALVKSL
jgi:hypothetical protein